MKIKAIIFSTPFVVVCVLIILIDLLYPVTFTFDSGHYMSYLDILSNKAPWDTWDPVRGIVFPSYLKFSLDLFGVNQNALLIPAIFLHIVLFAISAYLVIEETKVSGKKSEIIILVGVLIFIIIDPLILGYYHTVLTEFIASSIAIVSCLMAHLLIKNISSPVRISKTNLLIVTFFCLFVPLAWHLKQPYVGSALFPLLIASLLVIFRAPSKSVIVHMTGIIVMVLLSLSISIYAWNVFLPKTGEAANPDRKIESYLDSMVQSNQGLFLQSPRKFMINLGKNYLALANVFTFDSNYVVSKKVSFVRGYQNNAIGYRMYENPGEENAFYMLETYRVRVEPLISTYNPPEFFNEIQLDRTLISNFQFNFLYASLPFVVILLAVFKVKYYRKANCLNILLLCSGSALLNVVEHSFINMPIDRYIFWGYPLLLIFVVSIVVKLIQTISKKTSLIKFTNGPHSTSSSANLF